MKNSIMNAAVLASVLIVAMLSILLIANENPTGHAWLTNIIEKISEKSSEGKMCKLQEPCRRQDTSCGYGSDPYYLDGEYKGCITQLEAGQQKIPYCGSLLRNLKSRPCKPDDNSAKYTCVCA